MIDFEEDFYFIVNESLKTSEVIDALPQLCAGETTNEFDYILKCINESQYKDFARCILLFKLDAEPALGNSFIKYFNEAKQLLANNPEYERHITYYLDFILYKEIIVCKKHDLLGLIEQAYLLKLPPDSISNLEIQKKLNKILWKNIGKYSKSSSSFRALSIIFLIIQAEKYNQNLSEIKINLGSMLIDFIEQRNGFIFNDIITEHKIEEDREILDLLAQFDIDNKIFNEKLAYIKSKVDDLVTENNNKQGLIRAKDKIELVYIKENIYLNNSQCLMIEENRFFRMELYKAQYNLCPVYVKKYMPLDLDGDVSVIYNEVKCYQLLSSRINKDFCFLKFYGIFYGDGCIFLVMEYQEHNLMNYITMMKMDNNRVDEDLYLAIALKLLSSFAEMNAIGINHGNITPYNMLIDECLNIKIVDLSCSVIKIEKYLCSSNNGYYVLQDMNGYMAPELRNKIINSQILSLEKADVFSVGMILFQLYTLKNTGNLNQAQTNLFLIQEVNDIPDLRIRKLLLNMLNADPEKRENFRNLLTYIDTNYETITLE